MMKPLYLLIILLSFSIRVSGQEGDVCYECGYEDTADEVEISIEAQSAVEDLDLEPPLILDLPTAISFALKANRTLINAAENILKSKLNLDLTYSAFGLKMAPSVDLGMIGGGEAGTGGTVGGSIEFTQKFATNTRISIRPYITKDAHRFHTGLKAMIAQPLLRGFGTEFGLAPVYAASYSQRSALQAAYLAGVETIMRIITSMYSIIKSQNQMAFDREALFRLQNFFSAIKVKERIGMADSLDVYRTESEIKQAQDNLNNSLEHLEDALDRLRDLLGLSLGKRVEIQLPLTFTPLEPDVEQAIEAGLINRVEIQQANGRVMESRRLSRLAKNNTLPDLDLVMDFSNIGYDEVFTNTFTSQRDSRWGIGLMSSSDWDRTSQEVAFQQSILGISQAERSFDQIQDNIVLDIKRTIRALHRASQRITLQEEQIRNSEGGLRLAKLKFDRGLANNFDVIQAEKALRQAQTAHLNAIVEHKIGEYKYLASIGMLVDKPPFCK